MDIQILASSSKGNCYLVSDSATLLLLEMGLNWNEVRIMSNFRTGQIKGALLTHEHKDHSGYWKNVAKAGIDIFCGQPTIDALGMEGHRIHAVEPLKTFSIGSFLIIPFRLEHDVPILGYLLESIITNERLVFITDSFYCRYKFDSVNYIMVECNHSLDLLHEGVKNGTIDIAHKNRLMQSHFSLERVKEFLQANDLSQVKSIYLLHLSENNSDAELFKREIQALTGKPTYVYEKEE